MIRGPRCRGVATTVHHRIPSSQRPDLFFVSDNLVAACTACNYGGGSRTRADNERRRIEQLEEVIVEQDQTIQQLLERLSQYESERPDSGIRRNRVKPAIY
jgi:5-methylcytosine-specific restriction endonuclease McrA